MNQRIIPTDAGSDGEANRRPEQHDPVRVWFTKGISFWAALSTILVKAQPNSVLEFGGGRSTTFLADYVEDFGKVGITIEQSDVWHKKIKDDLKFMAVKNYAVHHVPVTATPMGPAWYDFAEVSRLIGDRTFDMVFVDGPVGEGRRNPHGQEIIAKAARKARLIIVDDVHRGPNLRFFSTLTHGFAREGTFFCCYRQNLIALAAAAEWIPVVRDTFQFLNLPYEHHFADAASMLEAR
ncbi:MAG: hypothetical protein WD036_10195 [Bauldia sp.]